MVIVFVEVFYILQLDADAIAADVHTSHMLDHLKLYWPTVSFAELLFLVPNSFSTRHVYSPGPRCPCFCTKNFSIFSCWAGILIPLRSQVYDRGAAPVAWHSKTTSFPTARVRSAGCFAMAGHPPMSNSVLFYGLYMSDHKWSYCNDNKCHLWFT